VTAATTSGEFADASCPALLLITAPKELRNAAIHPCLEQSLSDKAKDVEMGKELGCNEKEGDERQNNLRVLPPNAPT